MAGLNWSSAVALCLALAGCVHLPEDRARMSPLDQDPPRYLAPSRPELLDTPPAPGVALARSIVVPGAGWFYTGLRCGGRWGDGVVGLLHLGTTVAGAIVTRNAVRHGDDDGVTSGLALVALSRSLDFWGVTQVADERARACRGRAR